MKKTIAHGLHILFRALNYSAFIILFIVLYRYLTEDFIHTDLTITSLIILTVSQQFRASMWKGYGNLMKYKLMHLTQVLDIDFDEYVSNPDATIEVTKLTEEEQGLLNDIAKRKAEQNN